MWLYLIASVLILVFAGFLCSRIKDNYNDTMNQERAKIIQHIELLVPYKKVKIKKYILSKYSPWLIAWTRKRLQNLMGTTDDSGMRFVIKMLKDDEEYFWRGIDEPFLYDFYDWDEHQRHKQETFGETNVMERYKDIFYMEYILGKEQRVPIHKDTNLLNIK